MTTNLVSKQNSDRKIKTIEVDQESTPATTNKNWENYDSIHHHHGGSFTNL
jgi:hypothetical protein